MPLEFIYVGTALICASIGAASDVRTRKIPNRLTGPSILAGLALHLILGGWHSGWHAAWHSLSTAALAGLIGGGVFVVFHIAGGMGAGDVKLMTAVACLAGLDHVAEILIATALMGGVFAVVLALSRGRLKATLANIGILAVHHGTSGLTPHADLNVNNPETLRLPYGIAIAAGAALSFCGVALR